ncbi:hypothetical protein BDV59DRAFT_205319 [Aspergillus ambiguus]|uniref:FAD-dependent oxidoreductase n=1 Tax=Aspergillus ambiguus TaxID=176160 RepID=UPI003CCD4A55
MKVVIVGAGPCGLLLTVLLSKQGIHVQLLEASSKLDEQPRACHYSAPAKYELARAGVLDKIEEEGFHPSGLDTDLRMHQIVCLELGRVIKILYDEASKSKHAEILMNHEMTGIDQTSPLPRIRVRLPSGESRIFDADYIVGCDGANSQVRRSLFGDRQFPGCTWEQQIIATNVYYDFDRFKYDDSNFIIDQNNWYMAAKISKNNLWRVTYGDVSGLTKEQYIERLPMRYKQLLPGQPEPSEYKVINVGPYKMHQRLAPSMRAGNILLVGDAAHLCNPFGGFGLTGGIADAGALYDALIGIHMGKADDNILDQYDIIRREKYRTIVDPMSTAHFKRLWAKDPDTTIAEDEFLHFAKAAATNKQLARQAQQGAMSLRCDLTKFYNTAAKDNGSCT